jgi:hypothetical protein
LYHDKSGLSSKKFAPMTRTFLANNFDQHFPAAQNPIRAHGSHGAAAILAGLRNAAARRSFSAARKCAVDANLAVAAYTYAEHSRSVVRVL